MYSMCNVCLRYQINSIQFKYLLVVILYVHVGVYFMVEFELMAAARRCVFLYELLTFINSVLYSILVVLVEDSQVNLAPVLKITDVFYQMFIRPRKNKNMFHVRVLEK